MMQTPAEIIRQLRSALSKMEMALGSIPDAIAMANADGNIQWCNQPFAQLVKQSDAMLSGENLVNMIPLHERGQDFPTDNHPVNVTLAAGADVAGIYEFRNGARKLIMEVTTTLNLSGKKERTVVLLLHDVTERYHAQEMVVWDYKVQVILDSILNISLQPHELKATLAKSLDTLLAMSPFSRLEKGAIFIAAADEKAPEILITHGLPNNLKPARTHPSQGTCLCGQHGRTAENHEIVFVEQVHECNESTHNGIGPRHGYFCTPILAGGKLLGVINIYVETGHVRKSREDRFLKMLSDTLASVIQRKRAEEQLEQLAHLDSLTGLPNRPLFFDRLQQALAQARRQKNIFAVFFLDLDQFKDINDSLGHEAGDAVLKESAQRMLRCVREMDSVARMGGDEFTFIVLAGLQQPGDAAIVAKRVLHEMEAPFALKGEKRHISASIGIATYPDDGDDSETLVRRADAAMYQAKKKGGTYSFYSQKTE
ncbi:MAG: diguanylate cyclase [Mariprofundaceae bacterium]|nr:diguanylate cyclase [Mariprofundaceae bacterium]